MAPRRQTPQPRRRPSITDALFSQTQLRVLSLFFGQADRSFGLIELITLVGSGRGVVQREVQRLVESGLVNRIAVGRDHRYQANRTAPVFDELRSIIEKTTGVGAVVRDALRPLADRIVLGVMFGSIAKETSTATSDIDVLLVSDALTLEEVFEVVGTAERRLGRPVSPTLYTTREFREARAAGEPFLRKVLGDKHVVLVGSLDAVGASR